MKANEVMRIGSFIVSVPFVASQEVLMVLEKMEFTPQKIEPPGLNGSVKYTGFSPLFEDVEPGEIPDYYIQISKDSENDLADVRAIMLEPGSELLTDTIDRVCWDMAEDLAKYRDISG